MALVTTRRPVCATCVHLETDEVVSTHWHDLPRPGWWWKCLVPFNGLIWPTSSDPLRFTERRQVCGASIHPITGQPARLDVNQERSSDAGCGPRGRFYEPNPEWLVELQKRDRDPAPAVMCETDNGH